MESDTDYRLRIQQAFEGMSVAGSVGAYQFHGRSADGRVADISVTSPSPACVTISVLSRENNGVASDELLAVVRNALNAEDVRPVADRVTVQSADIVDYRIAVKGFKCGIDEQAWIISRVVHSLNGSGFTTGLELEVKVSDVEYESKEIAR